MLRHLPHYFCQNLLKNTRLPHSIEKQSFDLGMYLKNRYDVAFEFGNSTQEIFWKPMELGI